jgi:hypothetical protein
MRALDVFSCQNRKAITNESELKKIGEGSGSRIKSEGKGTRTIQYPVTESEQGARENMSSRQDFIFACANLEGNITQDRCHKMYRI